MSVREKWRVRMMGGQEERRKRGRVREVERRRVSDGCAYGSRESETEVDKG